MDDLKRLWLQRNFRWMSLATLASRVGDSIDALTFAWLVFQLTGSTLLMGTILAVNALPNILLAPVSGVLADRWRKVPLIGSGWFGRGVLAFAVAVLLLAGQLQVWHLFVVTFLASTLETLASPAQSALAVHLVDKDQLATAAGVTSTLTTVAQMAGLGFAAVALATVGLGGSLVVDALLFLLAAACLTRTRIAGDQKSASHGAPSWKADLTEGWRFLAGRRTLLVVVVMALLVNLAFSPLNVLEAPYVKTVLAGGPEVLAGLGLALLSGLVIAGLFVGAVVKRWGTWPTVFGSLVGLALAFGLAGLPGLVPVPAPTLLALACYFTAGVFLSGVNAPILAWFSATVPADRQGRVFSVVNALSLAAMPVGSAASGALAAVWSIGAVFAGTAVFVLALCAVIWWGFRPVDEPAKAE